MSPPDDQPEAPDATVRLDAKTVPRQTDPWIGTLFGNYKAVRKLGEGGMGVVYEAEHQKIGHRGAVKILNHELALDAEYAQRFLNEARAVNIIHHSGLVEIFDYGKLPDGTLFYVMELLQGESLQHRISAQPGPWTTEDVVRLSAQVAQALAAAHEKGIIHRDLKPDNFMLVKDEVRPLEERVKILDFGIAKLSMSAPPSASSAITDKTQMKTFVGAMMGTPLYMAPEQWGQAESVDGRADVFALGVTMYALLAGKHPYKASSMSLLTQPVPPLAKAAPKAAPRLVALVERMMQVTAAQRPTMAEVATELEAMRPKRLRSRDLIAGALLGALLVAILLIGVDAARKQWSTLSPAELDALALSTLRQGLEDKDPGVRVQAAQALGQSRDSNHRLLLENLLKDSNTDVVVQAALSLGQLGTPLSREALRALVSSGSPNRVRMAAASSLAQIQDPIGLSTLKELHESGQHAERTEAALRLVDLGELKAADFLWRPLSEDASLSSERLKLAGRLAQAAYQPAVERLRRELDKPHTWDARCSIAFFLARGGDEAGRQFLRERFADEKSAHSEERERLLIARFLAALGEPLSIAIFAQYLQHENSSEPNRLLAIEGLADSGRSEAAAMLGALLQDRKASAPQRLAAAGGRLRLRAEARDQMEQQSLAWANAALHTDSTALRELAVAMYDSMSSPQALSGLISAAQPDKERIIRERAVLALGRREVRDAIRGLLTSLSDPDAEIRAAAVQSVRSILATLRKRGDTIVEKTLLDRLAKLAESGTDTDRIAANGLLFELGDKSRRPLLVAAMTAKESRVRRLALEFIDATPEEFARSISDVDLLVRLSAARRLSALGDARGKKVLRDIVAHGAIEGLGAYAFLRKLGEMPQPPPDLEALLLSGDLATRFSVVMVLPTLDEAAAAHLLKLACLDHAGVVRSRALSIAGDFYRRTRRLTFIDMIRTLRSDPEVIVRSQAATLLQELEQPPSVTAAAQMPKQIGAQSEAPLPKPEPPDLGSASPSSGILIVSGQSGVRFWIDKGQAQPVNGPPISLAAGKHDLFYAGGSMPVQITPGQTTSARLSLTLTDQMVIEGRAAARKDPVKARQLLESARRMLRRNGQQSTEAEISVQLGMLLELEGKTPLVNALQEYNQALAVPARLRSAETNSQLQKAFARLASRVGRIQYRNNIGPHGECDFEKEELHEAGHPLINGKPVFIQAGKTTEVNYCASK